MAGGSQQVRALHLRVELDPVEVVRPLTAAPARDQSQKSCSELRV